MKLLFIESYEKMFSGFLYCIFINDNFHFLAMYVCDFACGIKKTKRLLWKILNHVRCSESRDLLASTAKSLRVQCAVRIYFHPYRSIETTPVVRSLNFQWHCVFQHARLAQIVSKEYNIPSWSDIYSIKFFNIRESQFYKAYFKFQAYN